MKKIATFAAILSHTAQLACAWSINGHIYVTTIAERLLSDNDAAALGAVYDMLGYLTAESPDFTWREDEHALVESSTFTDDWKYSGEAWQGAFHYVNIPWVAQGNPSSYTFNSNDKNIIDGTNDIIAWLSGKQGEGYKSSYIYDYLVNRKYAGKDENIAKSYALRMLIHQMGDLSQPLHTMDRFTKKYPDGDAGGNAFKL